MHIDIYNLVMNTSPQVMKIILFLFGRGGGANLIYLLFFIEKAHKRHRNNCHLWFSKNTIPAKDGNFDSKSSGQSDFEISEHSYPKYVSVKFAQLHRNQRGSENNPLNKKVTYFCP